MKRMLTLIIKWTPVVQLSLCLTNNVMCLFDSLFSLRADILLENIHDAISYFVGNSLSFCLFSYIASIILGIPSWQRIIIITNSILLIIGLIDGIHEAYYGTLVLNELSSGILYVTIQCAGLMWSIIIARKITSEQSENLNS